MKIYSQEECQQWVGRRGCYPLLEKVFVFEPKIEDRIYFTRHIVDICGKSFQHDLDRIKKNFEVISSNYPKAIPLLETLNIFMCPNPTVNTANAMACNDYICYFARSTQIPWCMTDYITAHELGHVIETNLCSGDKKDSLFRKYLELRNAPKDICNVYVDWDDEKDEGVYEDKEEFVYFSRDYKQKQKAHGEWDTNPLEWFAEDFRYLFGVDQGDKFWGLSIPRPDDEIKEFFLSL